MYRGLVLPWRQRKSCHMYSWALLRCCTVVRPKTVSWWALRSHIRINIVDLYWVLRCWIYVSCRLCKQLSNRLSRRNLLRQWLCCRNSLSRRILLRIRVEFYHGVPRGNLQHIHRQKCANRLLTLSPRKGMRASYGG